MRKDLRSLEARQAAIKCVAEAVHRQTKQYGQVPALDLQEDMKVWRRST